MAQSQSGEGWKGWFKGQNVSINRFAAFELTGKSPVCEPAKVNNTCWLQLCGRECITGEMGNAA